MKAAAAPPDRCKILTSAMKKAAGLHHAARNRTDISTKCSQLPEQTVLVDKVSSQASATGAPARALLSHRHARLGVVKVCGDMKLEKRHQLSQDMLGRSILLLPLHAIVGFDDLRQLVRQVILRPVAFETHSQNC